MSQTYAMVRFGRSATLQTSGLRNITRLTRWGFGGGLPPPKISFSPVQGDKVALHGRKRTILGGFATLQTSPQEATA
jgi:hypothetical protein